MARKNKRHQLLFITLLLCCIQVAGIDLYAQEPITVIQQDSLRTAPKARARRHREPAKQQAADTLKMNIAALQKDSIQLLKPLEADSALIAATDSIVADSLATINANNLKKIETASTSPVVLPKDSIAPEIPQKIWLPNPTKATWLALVFPGGGQIYNRKYWKLPIIYGGFAGCAYALAWNGKTYKDYSQAYLDIMDNNPSTKSYLDLLPANYKMTDAQLKEILRRQKDKFRRYRDLSIFAFIGVYLISIIDAYVDAELSNFDISPDLGMRVEPTIINDQFHTGSKSVGVQCSLRF